MSIVRKIIKNNIERLKVDELLAKEYEQAGYGGITLTKTPMGAQINLYAMRPGRVIGKRGRAIKAASERLETELGLPNPQITVIEVEVPELNPAIMAARIANALERGVHFRRSIFWSLRRIMDSGALGCEIILKGPLRSARSRFEKVVEGYVPKSGEPALRNVKIATIHVKMKRGTLGVTVKIVPPDAEFPDKVSLDGLPDIEYQLPMEEPAPVAEVPAEAVVDETIKAVEPKTDAAEPVITDEAATEEAPVVEETPVKEAVVEESAPVEPAVEEPATEEVAEVVEEAVEKPVVEESIAEEAAVEKPIDAVEPEAAEAVVEDAAVEAAVDEPVVEESIAEEAAVEEVTEAAEPVVEEEAVEEPAVEEAVAEVAEEPVAEKPTVEETIEAAEPAVAEEVVEEEAPVPEETPVEEPAAEPVVEESAPEEAAVEEPEADEEPQAEPVITESAPEVSEPEAPEEPAAEPELVSEPEPVAEKEEETVETEPKVKPKPEADMAEKTTDDQPEEEKQ